MYGVSKINIEPSLMMISVQDVEFKGNSLARYLQIFADNGVVRRYDQPECTPWYHHRFQLYRFQQ